MVATLTVRMGIALSLLASLTAAPCVSAAPMQQDTATTILIAGNRSELQSTFAITPPSGFSAPSFHPSTWHPANASPCSHPSWILPPGSTGWLWNPVSCTTPTSSVALRRTFVVPAQAVVTARLWFAIHGSGHAWVNGTPVGQSAGNPTLLDVTSLLRGNGVPNVLGFDATTAGDGGGGIAYALRLTLSTARFNAFRHTHPSYRIPAVPSVIAPPPPATVSPAMAGTATAAQAAGTCLSSQPTDVVAVLSGSGVQTRVSTGWVYGSNQSFVTNQPYVYVVTRLVDLSSIVQPSAMPTVLIGSQSFRAVAIANDLPTGDEVLVLPPAASTILTPLNLTLGATHNEPPGATPAVTADSRSLNCLAGYSPSVVGYPLQLANQPIALLTGVPSNDAADGGIAQDALGNFLGTLVFQVDQQGQQEPYVVPFSVMQPTLDALISVLTGRQPAATTQQVVVLTAATSGTSQLTYTHVTPVGAAAATDTPGPTAVTTVTGG